MHLGSGFPSGRRSERSRAERSIRQALIEALEERQLLSTYVVTTTSDSGSGSLRAAITNANNHAGSDTITFNLSGSSVIAPTSPLPTITGTVTIDGTTQPGYASTPIVELDGTSAGSTDGLYVTASGCTFTALVLGNWGYSGISLAGSGSNTISNCYIGTDVYRHERPAEWIRGNLHWRGIGEQPDSLERDFR